MRRYRERRGGLRFPLLELFEIVNSDWTEAHHPEQLAQHLQMPVAAVRGVLSYYADLREEEKFTKVCQGTSCVLNGGVELARSLRADVPYRSLYCLGYCDRSPAILRDGDELLLGAQTVERPLPPSPADGCSQQPPAPEVRCLAPEAIVTRRLARGDFSDLELARADGAYRSLERALAGTPLELIKSLEASGLRGRDASSPPTGSKWRRCAEAQAETHYVIANGDEGDPGAYIDRALMEQDPHGILEGLMLCAYAVGAREGIIFVRSEYPWARQIMQRAIEDARRAGLLGPAVLGSDFDFDVLLFRGMGSYVCGEETAMLNAIEGLRGEVRLRPPYPAVEGLFGRPTVVNHVETLINVPFILERGPEAYAALGTETSSGTKVVCLNRGFERPGIVEVEYGTSLRDVIDQGGAAKEGRELEAVILGGPMGSVLLPEEWDFALCHEVMAERGMSLGHAGMVAVPEGANWRALLKRWLQFMNEESCGKCLPCSLGSKRALGIASFPEDEGAFESLESLLGLMEKTSLCAFGQLIPAPLRKILQRFGDRIFDSVESP